MIGNAHIKETTMHLRFAWGEPGYLEGSRGLLGHGLMTFSRIRLEAAEQIIDAVMNIYLACILEGKTHKEMWNRMTELLEDALHLNLYVFLFLYAYAQFLATEMLYPKEAREYIESIRFHDGTVPEEAPPSSQNPIATAQWGKRIMLEGMNKRRDRLLKDLHFLCDEMTEYADLSPIQRLYLLTLTKRNDPLNEFAVTLEADMSFPNDATSDKIKAMFLEKGPEIIEAYTIDSIDALIRFELFSTLKTGLQIKKCRNCGDYFVPYGRSDAEYCDYRFGDDGKSCNEVGAVRYYKRKHADDPIYLEYYKAYKRYNNRVRYGRMTKEEFFAWSEEARQKRDDCSVGGLSFDEFKTWLGNP